MTKTDIQERAAWVILKAFPKKQYKKGDSYGDKKI